MISRRRPAPSFVHLAFPPLFLSICAHFFYILFRMGYMARYLLGKACVHHPSRRARPIIIVIISKPAPKARYSSSWRWCASSHCSCFPTVVIELSLGGGQSNSCTRWDAIPAASSASKGQPPLGPNVGDGSSWRGFSKPKGWVLPAGQRKVGGPDFQSSRFKIGRKL